MNFIIVFILCIFTLGISGEGIVIKNYSDFRIFQSSVSVANYFIIRSNESFCGFFFFANHWFSLFIIVGYVLMKLGLMRGFRRVNASKNSRCGLSMVSYQHPYFRKNMLRLTRVQKFYTFVPHTFLHVHKLFPGFFLGEGTLGSRGWNIKRPQK
jgi:hypothetical protein